MGKGGKRAEPANDRAVLEAAEDAVFARAANAAAVEDEALRAKRERKAAIRAKGLVSLPGAKKGGAGGHADGFPPAGVSAGEAVAAAPCNVARLARGR